MKVLVMNCGSSTLKFDVFETESASPGVFKRLAHGLVDRIGGQASIELEAGGRTWQETGPLPDHGAASRLALDLLSTSGILGRGEAGAVGHRVIHGSDRFSEPALIDDEVIAAIQSLSELAPLHNKPSLEAILAARAAVGPLLPMVAVFDTAFFRALPERACRYAIPSELAEKHHIRRYGFHGLAHRYMTERYSAITATPPDGVKLITLQLGNGCSATAINGGRPVDTSMGLTPLEGLVMGTRSGDVDPTLAGFLARRENTEVQKAEDWLNTKSGLLGVSGRSRDMRELLEAERRGDRRAALAVDMFCYRVKKYVGAYLAALGGADAVVFGGGIGENAPEVRSRICSGMEWCGLRLDADRNAAAAGREAAISRDDSRVRAYVIPVDEASVIAHDTLSVYQRTRKGGG